MTRPARGFLKAIADLQLGLGRVEAPSMLIGGVAVIAHGVPRTTLDVDATIEGSGLDLEELLKGLAAVSVEPRINEAIAFARTSQVLLLRHTPSGTPIDLSLAWLPFETEALQRSTIVSIGRTAIRVPHVEDLVLYKWSRHAPRISMTPSNCSRFIAPGSTSRSCELGWPNSAPFSRTIVVSTSSRSCSATFREGRQRALAPRTTPPWGSMSPHRRSLCGSEIILANIDDRESCFVEASLSSTTVTRQNASSAR